MTVEPSRQFSRDVRRLGSSQIRRRLDRTIQELIEAADIRQVSGVRRLQAEGQHYRIQNRRLTPGHHDGRRKSRLAPLPTPGRNLPLLSVTASAREQCTMRIQLCSPVRAYKCDRVIITKAKSPLATSDAR